MLPKLTLTLRVVTIVCSLSLASCASQQQESAKATPEELSRMNRDFAQALNEKDAVKAASQYTEDAVILPPNEAPISGRVNIEAYWKGAISAGAFDVGVATTTTGSNGDLGYEVGRFSMSTKDSTGKVSTERGKYIEMLRKDKDGVWRSFYAAWNTDTLALK